MRIAISLAAGLGLLSLSHAQSSTRQDVLQTLGLSQGQVLRLETPAAGEGSFTVPIDFTGAADLIARGLDAYRAAKDRPSQTLALHHLLERQHYKLGHWRLASSDINYRRFFDVNGLAGLRVEDLIE